MKTTIHQETIAMLKSVPETGTLRVLQNEIKETENTFELVRVLTTAVLNLNSSNEMYFGLAKAYRETFEELCND